jgi:hypothetical protein
VSRTTALRKKAKERARLLFDEPLMVRNHLALYRKLVPCEE